MDLSQTLPKDDTEISSPDKKQRTLLIVLCVALVLSLVIGWSPLRNLTAMPFDEALNSKMQEVTVVMVATMGIGVALDAIPLGKMDQLAAKLFNLAGYLMIVLGALVAMNILLTLSMLFSFGIIIPGALLFAIWSIVKGNVAHMILAKKLIIFALVFAFAIPASVGISLMIDNTFEAERARLKADLNAVSSEIQSVTEEIQVVTDQIEDYERGASNRIIDFFSGAVNTFRNIPNHVQNALNAIGDQLNAIPDRVNYIMQSLILIVIQWIITVCVVPIVTLIGFGFVIKILFGFDVNQKLAIATRTVQSKTASFISQGSRKLPRPVSKA